MRWGTILEWFSLNKPHCLRHLMQVTNFAYFVPGELWTTGTLSYHHKVWIFTTLGVGNGEIEWPIRGKACEEALGEEWACDHCYDAWLCISHASNHIGGPPSKPPTCPFNLVDKFRGAEQYIRKRDWGRLNSCHPTRLCPYLCLRGNSLHGRLGVCIENRAELPIINPPHSSGSSTAVAPRKNKNNFISFEQIA